MIGEGGRFRVPEPIGVRSLNSDIVRHGVVTRLGFGNGKAVEDRAGGRVVSPDLAWQGAREDLP